MSNHPVLVADNIHKTYTQGKLSVPVLQGVSLTIARQDTLAIVGASGSGKSTLLHVLGGLDAPTSGTVTLDGQDMASLSDQEKSQLRNEKLGFVYQFHHLLPEFTALENVAMPLLIRREKKQIAHERAAEMIRRVGLIDRLAHRPGELSGGERQRIAIARALVTEPLCLFADEPTGNLDQNTAKTIFNLMLELNQQGNTALVIVTHDLSLARQVSQVLELNTGTFTK
jgi:lipoprotein-releasing system ATP-binding protein